MSEATRIWVDADACPGVIRDILVRAANRAKVETIFVANQWIKLPTSPWLRAIQVPQGPDVADDEIAAHVRAGDLVVTQDIPLAAKVIEAGATAINPRGEPYTKDTISERLSIRNFMDELRGSGVQTGGPAPFHARDRQTFAAGVDRWLARRPPPAAPTP
ncbi:YaiI/YqxD family protein [Cognatilysobacter terrigena]|uniref:YaiI/YqxD family protein n=1 Tax=Cognatilysobacter terrigena TaxID=2488749 RepID=UPI00105C44F7|nr:YaiI/YqxD family protein [Lysobacter terrigena]